MIWFYSFIQPLSASQIASLTQAFDGFLANWKSHGTPVTSNIQFYHQHFIVIQAELHGGQPSGCSIDSMKKSVGEILQAQQLAETDAAQVFYQNVAGELASVHFKEIAQLLQSGELSAETMVFDHTLNQTGDFSQWEKPLKDTWLKRFLPKIAA
ncbi:MAG: hypothetical protein ACKVTZ_11315 [Bacteroidia bacterium]